MKSFRRYKNVYFFATVKLGKICFPVVFETAYFCGIMNLKF